MNFRASYALDLRMRLIDATLHIAAMLVLPSPWFLQLVPDLVLPAIWAHGIATNRFLPEDSPALGTHRILHLRGPFGPAALCAVMLSAFFWLPLAMHLLAHVAIDSVTHGEGWQ